MSVAPAVLAAPLVDRSAGSSAVQLLARAAELPVGPDLHSLLASIDPGTPDPDVAVRLAEQWARVEASACGHKLTAIGAMAQAELPADEAVDFRDLEVATALNAGVNTARNVMAVAATLTAKGQQVLGAMRDGLFGYGHALQFFDALVDTPTEQCDRVLEVTLTKALDKTPSQLRRLLRRAVTRVGAEDFAKRHEEATKDNHISVFFDEKDGTATLNGRMSAVDAAVVDQTVEAWARTAKAAGDPRSMKELRAAALVDMAERYAMGPDAPRPQGRPLCVNIAYDLPTFLGLTAHPGEILGSGALIPADALRDLIPHAALRRIITDPMTGHLLDFGRTTYRFPPEAKAFLNAKWVTSTGPGSMVPAERCDIDHVKPWDYDGVTSVGNGQPLNRRWHRAKTIGKWTVEQREDRWLWTSPHGLQRETSPHDYRLGP